MPNRQLPERCPACDSPQPHLHPAVQHEGECHVCQNDFHRRVTPENTVEHIASLGLAPSILPTTPNRQLPVLYAAVNEEMKVEYTSDDRDSADAYAFACKLKVFVYPPPTQMREVERLLGKEDRVCAGDEIFDCETCEFKPADDFLIGMWADGLLPIRRRETIAQGPARRGTCETCRHIDEDGEYEDGVCHARRGCMLGIDISETDIPWQEFGCIKHQEREGAK